MWLSFRFGCQAHGGALECAWGRGPSLPNQEQGEKMDRKVGSGYTNEGSEPKMLIEDNRVALIFS